MQPNPAARSEKVLIPDQVRDKEKIIFEIQPMMTPTIVNLENLTLIGFTFIIVLAAVIFRFGLPEFLIVGALYLLIAVPSVIAIFRAGATTYVLTNRRLVLFSMNYKSKERSIPLDQIQDAKCRFSGLQRLYGAGDIIVSLKGLRSPVKLYGLKKCKERAEQIRQAARNT